MGLSICLLFALPFLLFVFPYPTAAFYKYDSSFAFLNVRSKNLSPEGLDFCVNFQQWRKRQLPSSADTKTFVQIGWWNRTLNTDICLPNGHNFAKNELLPANYWTMPWDLSSCKFEQDEAPINATLNRLKPKAVRNVLFLVEKGKLNRYLTRDFLFSQFYNSEINDSDTSMSVFYVYNDSFQREIKPLLLNSSAGAELRFYRPQSKWPMDPSVVVLWLFAISSILIGSLWAAFESKTITHEKHVPLEIAVSEGLGSSRTALGEEDRPSRTNEPNSSKDRPLKRSQSVEINQMNVYQHLYIVLFAFVFIASVLILSYFFRKFAVLGFCILMWLFGICSVHNCVHSFLRTFLGDKKLPPLRNCCGGGKLNEDLSPPAENGRNYSTNEALPTNSANISIEPTIAASSSVSDSIQSSRRLSSTSAPIVSSASGIALRKGLSPFDRPTDLLSLVAFLLAVFLCTVWFIYREHHNAFYLLNSINIMVCIYTIKSSRVRSLRLLTFLLLAMFVYDLFMVFGTTLLTTDGCSVMMEVVTGVECQSKKAKTASIARKNYQPIAPINLKELPEKIPLVFSVPMLADPLGRCFDVEVEREYRRVLLGLGDVIIPGQLIAFCFYVDVVKRSRFYTYGSISIFGYSLGMLSTFVALLLMETGQPALLYLVPFTLGPIFAWAFFVDGNDILGKMWHGKL